MLSASEQFCWQLALGFRQSDLFSASDKLASLVRTDEDWNSLLPLVIKHRLLGAFALVAKETQGLPPHVLDQARRTHEAMRFRYHSQTSQLSEIMDSLGVLRVQLLKGLRVSDACYTPPEVRPCGDIDLLLPPTQIVEAIRRLCAIGFHLEPGQALPWPTPKWMTKLPIELDEVALKRDVTEVELHSHLLSYKLPHRFSSEELFESRDSFLPAEWTWIHLAVNQHMHHFSGGLGGLLDLTLWEDRHPLALDDLRALLRRWEIEYLVYPTLRRLMAFAPDLPSVSLISDPPDAADQIFKDCHVGKGPSHTHWYWIRKSSHPIEGLALNFFPPMNRMAVRYGLPPNDPRLWARRLSRPFELLGQRWSR